MYIETKETTGIDGQQFREMFAFATDWLAKSENDINALNVFPVPDGDTGTNMVLTMRSLNEEAEATTGKSLSGVVQAMARGALMGARGNSGVILSQIWSGISQGLQGQETLNGCNLAEALHRAADTAYEALSHPVEGTMLTVMRDAAAAACRLVSPGEGTLVSTLEAAVEAASKSVANTPNLLPILKEAGVVDSGGQGLYIIFEGALLFLKGQTAAIRSGKSRIINMNNEAASTPRLFEMKDEVPFGYCTEFIIQGSSLSISQIEKRLKNKGQSLIVVGDSSTVKVHIHALDPSPVFHYAISLGTLANVSMRNMDEQYRELIKSQKAQKASVAGVSVVTVASGSGFLDIFKKLGAAAIVPGGKTMNPSAKEILQAVENVNSNQVIILPNDKNLVLVSQQIRSMAGKDIRVVPSISIPQGIAALIALDPQGDVETNVKLMEESRVLVKTIEVTRSIRSSQVNGFTIRKNQAIGLLDGRLAAVHDNTGEAVLAIMAQIDLRDSETLVLYYGAGTSESEALLTKDLICQKYPSLDVQAISGGQPLYHYIVSIE
jgi:uncharacterized protein